MTDEEWFNLVVEKMKALKSKKADLTIHFGRINTRTGQPPVNVQVYEGLG